MGRLLQFHFQPFFSVVIENTYQQMESIFKLIDKKTPAGFNKWTRETIFVKRQSRERLPLSFHDEIFFSWTRKAYYLASLKSPVSKIDRSPRQNLSIFPMNFF